jgi:hypothetical protein
MTTVPDPERATRVIMSRLRVETRRIFFFALFALLVQVVSDVLYYAAEEKSFRFNGLGLMLFPAGWVIPFCLAGYFVRRQFFRRDIEEGPVTSSSVFISKASLEADFDSGTPRDDQHITLRGQRGKFLVPLEYWNTMPETQDANCQFFRNSKVMLSINGQGVWAVHQSGSGPAPA